MNHLCKNNNCDCQSVEILSKLLANTYILMLKTQNIHWNIKGKSFRSIHLMTEEHYNNLFIAIDEIAETILMVGGTAPASFSEFSKLSNFDEKIDINSQDTALLQELLNNHITIQDEIIKDIAKLNEAKYSLTIDILNKRLAFHKKAIWMLSATIN